METTKSSAWYIVSSKHWLAKIYLQDLTEYATGDVNRFGRMVGSHGEGLGSERQWVTHLNNIFARPDVQTYFPAELAAMRTAFVALGYALAQPEPKPEQETKTNVTNTDAQTETRPQAGIGQPGQPDQVAPSQG